MNENFMVGFGAGIIACNLFMVSVGVCLILLGYTNIDFILT